MISKFALLGLMVLPIFAATQGQPARPRIGIALGGGGALGIAHVGVLQWMEEHRIPIDDIAGTSMGGIVGAMYATGMSAAEMRAFVKAINWDQTLLSEPRYPELSFRRKQDRRDFQVPFPLGLKHGLSIPNALNPGHGVGLLVDRIAFPYSNLQSFDELPIPFRCVATDLLKGEPVVLKGGSLAESLRATSAVPGVFVPVELQGRFLVDGGILNNLPVRAARDMGGQIVIAVALEIAPPSKADLQSIGGVLSRTVSIAIIDNERRSLRQADIILAIALGNHSTTDYAHTEELMQLGYEGAAQKAAVLLPFALSEGEWTQYLAARRARKRVPQKSADLLQVTGASPRQRQELERKLDRYLHLPLDRPGIESELTHITGEGTFDSIGYQGFSQGNVPGLLVSAHQKTYGPPFLDLGVNLRGSGVGDLDFSLGGRITVTDFPQHGGEWRSDVLLGSNDFLRTEIYQPIGKLGFFVAPNLFFAQRGRNSYENGDRVALFRDRRSGGGIDVGYNSGKRSEFRFGYQIDNDRLVQLIGSGGLPRLQGYSGQLRFRSVFDGQDSPTVPSRGERITVEASHVFEAPDAPRAFYQLQVQSSTFLPVSSRASFFLNLSAGTTFNHTAGPFQVFSLGGPLHLGAYNVDEFTGNHYGLGVLGFRRDFYQLPKLAGRKVYWGGWYEAGSAFRDPARFAVRESFSLGVIADTVLGTVAISGSVGPSGRTKINFSLGRLF